MIKGNVILKTNKSRKYADIYRAFIVSDHDVLIVRCPDEYVLKHARHAAIRFRENNGLKGCISISKYGNNLYIMKIGDQKHAMEAIPHEDGWIFYYEKGEYE